MASEEGKGASDPDKGKSTNGGVPMSPVEVHRSASHDGDGSSDALISSANSGHTHPRTSHARAPTTHTSATGGATRTRKGMGMTGTRKSATGTRSRKWKSPMKEYKKESTYRRPSFDVIPGPAAYPPPKLEGPSGGRFSTAKPKSKLDWIIYRAKDIPGPDAYGAPKLPGVSGGRFSTAKPKSNIDWIVYHKREIPSAAHYNPPALSKPSGGRISMANPKSKLDWELYRASEIPAPNHYIPKTEIMSNKLGSPAYSVQGKLVRGNHQTHLTDSISFVHTTVNPKGPNSCRSDSAFGKQHLQYHKNAGAIMFGTEGLYERPKPRPKTVSGGRFGRSSGRSSGRASTSHSRRPQREPRSASSSYRAGESARSEGEEGDGTIKEVDDEEGDGKAGAEGEATWEDDEEGGAGRDERDDFRGSHRGSAGPRSRASSRSAMSRSYSEGSMRRRRPKVDYAKYFGYNPETGDVKKKKKGFQPNDIKLMEVTKTIKPLKKKLGRPPMYYPDTAASPGPGTYNFVPASFGEQLKSKNRTDPAFSFGYADRDINPFGAN